MRLLATVFSELRRGQTVDGKAKVKSPSTVLSTAELISVVADGALIGSFFGQGQPTVQDCFGGAGRDGGQGEPGRPGGAPGVPGDGGEGALGAALARPVRRPATRCSAADGRTASRVDRPDPPPLASRRAPGRSADPRAPAAGGADRGAGRRDAADRAAVSTRPRCRPSRSTPTGGAARTCGRRTTRSAPTRRSTWRSGRPGGRRRGSLLRPAGRRDAGLGRRAPHRTTRPRRPGRRGEGGVRSRATRVPDGARPSRRSGTRRSPTRWLSGRLRQLRGVLGGGVRAGGRAARSRTVTSR